MIFTWKCDICGKQKLDEDIRVLSYPLKDFPLSTRNLKYCADNKECYDKAILKSKTGKM